VWRRHINQLSHDVAVDEKTKKQFRDITTAGTSIPFRTLTGPCTKFPFKAAACIVGALRRPFWWTAHRGADVPGNVHVPAANQNRKIKLGRGNASGSGNGLKKDGGRRRGLAAANRRSSGVFGLFIRGLGKTGLS
jgi:hypothetical protein